MKYFFLVPALNEEVFLEKTLNELIIVIKKNKIINYEITIIDDGSIDKTYEIALSFLKKNSNVKIIKNKINIGVSQNLKKFLHNLHINEDGKLILISGDNDLSLDFIDNLIVASKSNELVLGYYVNREKKGLLRASLSTMFNFLYCTLFNVYAFYLQGPFVWPIKELKKLKIYSSSIAYVSEVNIKLLRSGLKFTEVSGIMNTGSVGSTSLKFKNFIEIFLTTCHLAKEIYFLKNFKKQINRNLIL